MRRRPNFLFLFLLGVAAECVAFIIVARFIGFFGAVLLSLATTYIGVQRLKKSGSSALNRFRAAVSGQHPPLDDVVDTISGLLLALPGFLTDLAGLALASTPGRQWAQARLGDKTQSGAAHIFGSASFGRDPSPKPNRAKILDLTPDEWQRADKN